MDKLGATALKVSTQITSGEALFVLQGSPYKSNKNGEALIKAESHSVDALLQFELKFDSLRTYLEGFTTAINQHASLINQLESDVTLRLIESNLYGVIQKLGTSSIIKDKAVNSILGPLVEAPRPENTGKKAEDTVNAFCNRLEVFTHGFAHLNQMNVKVNERVDRTDAQISKKVNTDEFKAKVKRTRTKLRTKMDDNYKTLEDKIKLLEAKLDTKVGALDRKIDEVEKHTTWRIKDCEDLLRSRINDTYVDDAIRILEERLKKEIEQMTFGSTESFKQSIKELAEKIKQCEDHVEDKVAGLKKNIKDVETSVTKRLETSKFDEFKKEILARLDTESEKIRAVSRKCEPAIDSLNGDMVKVNEEITQLKKQIKNMSVDIENLLLSEMNNKNNIPIQIPIPSSTNGPSKEDMEAYFSKYRQEINRLKETVKAIEDEIQNKVDSSVFNMQLAKKMDKSELDALLATLKSDMEKIRKFMRDSEGLQSKVDKIDEIIDKRLAKFRKEFDFAAMLKQLKTKAEEDNVSKGFENTDKKINALSENLLALKKELENALMSLERLSVNAFSYSSDAFLSTKKINPLACLSCGNKTKQHNPVHTMVGNDGKLYRSDASVQEYSMQEIYDTTQSPDLRAVLNKSLVPRDGREKTIAVNYTYVQGVTSASRIRPQTATGRAGKAFKPQPTSPVAYSETTTHRPSSAKK